jgi:hypothetical protein
MAGGNEDANPHEGEASPHSTPKPAPPPTNNEGGIPLHKTGEIMLGLSLTIILIVIICVIAHLLLKERRKRYPNGRPKKKKKKKTDLEKGTVELHSIDKKVFEAGGTEVVLCELPEAPPIQELDGGFGGFVFPFSPMERSMTGTTDVTDVEGSDMEISPAVVSPVSPWPEQPLAVYWSSR